MDAATRELVFVRAGGRCEYCRLPQSALELTFHVEHVIALQHGGTSVNSNLALACDRCNLKKGPNLSAIDPVSREIVRLCDPRQSPWDEHFHEEGTSIVGNTSIGRATVSLLNMNSRSRRELRARLLSE